MRGDTGNRILDALPAAAFRTLSALLAATRPRVTQAAAKLKAEGIIDYRRAMVRILDRERLEAASCECYEDTRHQT